MERIYIVITGSDGCGKETQARLLEENLTNLGLRVKRISFPNYESQSSGPVKLYLGGELGANANDVNPYQASMAYAVDRFCTMKQFLNNDDNTQVVIFDRYAESNIIHQAIKIEDEGERKKFISWLDDIEFNKLEIPRPNLTLFLDVPTAISFSLAQKRAALKNQMQKDIHEKDYAFMEKSYEFGIKIAKDLNWKIIDCCDHDNAQMFPREDIAEMCLAQALRAIASNNIENKNANIECGERDLG